MLLRPILLLFLIQLPFWGFLQENLLPDSSLNLPVTFGFERNPQDLVNRLTAGAKTEKESFDLILTWVARNIEYDKRAYFSTSGTKTPDIDRILRRKKGICLDYAFLMDTLCKLAGIHNVTVLGYYKDNLFDVDDPIYADNHAWNAVKLSNKWYLYDATMISGHITHKIRRLSALVLKWMNKLQSKTKQKTKIYKIRRSSECVTKRSKHKVTFQQIPLLNRILLRILELKIIRYRIVVKRSINLNFYLTQPEVFAITHHPDNPYWSLLEEPRTIGDFASDSAFYYLQSSDYKHQKRNGKICYPCDNYLDLDELERNKEMKRNSVDFNPNNQFIPFSCDYAIGMHFFEESLPLVDSLPKISNLDSTLFYLNYAKRDLSKFSKNIKSESKFHFDKNKKKLVQLRKENRNHTLLINSIVKSTFVQARKMKAVNTRNRGLLNTYQQTIRKVRNIQIKAIREGKPKPMEKLKPVEEKLQAATISIDSLNQLIGPLKETYLQKLTILSDRSWKKRNDNSRISGAFFYDAFLRKIYQLDNNKLIINEQRKSIKKLEESYVSYIGDSILKLVDTCQVLNSKIADLIKKRNQLFFKSAKLINTLISEKITTSDSLINFKSNCVAQITEDKCWIIKQSPFMSAVYDGVKYLGFSEKSILKSIRIDNLAELQRYKIIKKEITRRKQRNINIYKNNRDVTVKTYKKALLAKKDFLKKLRNDRKRVI